MGRFQGGASHARPEHKQLHMSNDQVSAFCKINVVGGFGGAQRAYLLVLSRSSAF